MRNSSLFRLSVVTAFLACRQTSADSPSVQQHIDSLEAQVAGAYKPGLGEMMLYVQIHHAKLWFAGQHENWPLAKFELEELHENAEDIFHNQIEKDEIKTLETIFPAIDSLEVSIEQQNLPLFNQRYRELTQTCNACHQFNRHPYNVIKIPESPPFSNQDFNPVKQ